MNTARTLALLALAFIIAFLLYPRPAARDAAAGKTDLTLWVNVSASESMQTACAQFEREYPQYHVTIGAATVRDATADPTRFLLGVAGGAPPDVIYFDRYAIVEWAARGAFRDLTPYLKADAKRPDGVHRDDYYAPMFDEPVYQGKQYGIPNGVDVRGLFINDDCLIRAGYVNNDGSIRPPKTWEDLCRKKFQGSGTITSYHLRLGKVGTLPGVGPYALSVNPPRVRDVVTLRSGTEVFRARIKDIQVVKDRGAGDQSATTQADAGATSWNPSDYVLGLDFGAEQPPGTTRIPASIASDPNAVVKVFDQDSYAIRMSRYDERGNLAVAGFTPMAGNAWLYIYGWQNGATFMSADGKKVELDQPRVAEALQFVVDCYDALGGTKKVRVYEAAQQQGSPLDPFLTGKLAMRIDGNWFLGTISQFKPDLRFTLVPAPIPAQRLAEGRHPITWAGGWAYAIPSTAKHPDGAWKLIRYLMSDQSQKLQTDVDASLVRAQGQVFMPPLSVKKDMMPWLRKTYLDNQPSVSGRELAAYDTFTELLPHAKYRPITPVGQKLWKAQMDAQEAAMLHTEEIHDALAYRTRNVQAALDQILHPPTGPVVHWWWVIGAYVALLAIGGGALVVAEKRYRAAGLGKRDWRSGFLSVSPWLLGFIIVGGGPILFSLFMSFCQYDVLNAAHFTGLHNYVQLLGFHTDQVTGHLIPNDPDMWISLWNTAFMTVGIPLGIVAGLLLAMLLSHSIRGIGAFRTIYYLPSIVPAIAGFLLWMWIFDPNRGLLNSVLRTVGVANPPSWLTDAAWSKPALIIMGLWGVGGGMLIWLAGIKAIPVQLYEAAEIDGAGLFSRFFRITLPMLSPYILFNTIMGVIGTLQTFDAAYVMTNGGPSNSTMFYAYKLFNEAFRYLNMGAASAMAWILFAVVFALTLLQLWLSRKWVHYG